MVMNSARANRGQKSFATRTRGKLHHPLREQDHYDGAKNEEAIIQVWGMGPATSTAAEKR
jgi:hypothetical protein